jgi:hypothetical protein
LIDSGSIVYAGMTANALAIARPTVTFGLPKTNPTRYRVLGVWRRSCLFFAQRDADMNDQNPSNADRGGVLRPIYEIGAFGEAHLESARAPLRSPRLAAK